MIDAIVFATWIVTVVVAVALIALGCIWWVAVSKLRKPDDFNGDQL